MSEGGSAQARQRQIVDERLRASMAALARLRAQGHAVSATTRPTRSQRTGHALSGSAGVPVPHPARFAQRPPATVAKDDGWGAFKAALRGAADSVPFDLVDRGTAFVHAAGDTLRGGSPIASYDRRFEAEKAQDRYDAAVHPRARTAGKVAGTAAQLLAPGLVLTRLGSVVRMAEAAPLVMREIGSLTGIGAAGGVAAQGMADVAARRRGSLADYGGSALGGAAGVLAALRGRPGLAGGIAGGASSLGQDLLNGRVRSWQDAMAATERAAEDSAAGHFLAMPLGRGAARAVDALPSFKRKDAWLPNKGDLGEYLSKIRTRLRGDTVLPGGRTIRLPDGGRSFADHLTAGGEIVEAKFGRTARLSNRQKQVRARNPDDYRVDHFLPEDLGLMAAVPTGMITFQDWDADGR